MDDKKAFNRLIQEMADAVSRDSESAKSYLKGEGIDSDELVESGAALVKRMKFLRQAELNEKQDKVLEEKAWGRILKTAKEKAISELEAIKLLIPNLKGAPALYSKLEKFSEEDLKNTLQEEGVLKLMEEMENKKKND
ncbi:MAG: hypothetical protein AAF149_13705 [Bacteroidota bacterium]